MDPISIIGLMVGVLGIPLAWWLARRTRQLPDLRYALDVTTLLTVADGIPERGLRIASSGRDVSRLSRTRIAFWNARGDTVHGDDVVDSDLLRLAFSSPDSVLNARVVTSSRDQIALSVTPEAYQGQDLVPFTFDFLDSGDGGVIEVLHVGPEPPRLLGTVKGARLRRVKGAEHALSNEGLQERAGGKSTRRLKTARLFGVVTGVMLAMMLSVTAYAMARGTRSPGLVDIKAFDLSTPQGQRAFAETAIHQGPPINSGWLVVASTVYLFFLAFNLLLILRILKSPIPRTIVRPEDLLEDFDDSQGS